MPTAEVFDDQHWHKQSCRIWLVLEPLRMWERCAMSAIINEEDRSSPSIHRPQIVGRHVHNTVVKNLFALSWGSTDSTITREGVSPPSLLMFACPLRGAYTRCRSSVSRGTKGYANPTSASLIVKLGRLRCEQELLTAPSREREYHRNNYDCL